MIFVAHAGPTGEGPSAVHESCLGVLKNHRLIIFEDGASYSLSFYWPKFERGIHVCLPRRSFDGVVICHLVIPAIKNTLEEQRLDPALID